MGFIVDVVYDQDNVWSKGFGRQNPFDPNNLQPPTRDSVYVTETKIVLTLHRVAIASITKAFTTLMLAQLRDHGVVSLDDPLWKFYPNFSMIDPYDTNREITLREVCPFPLPSFASLFPPLSFSTHLFKLASHTAGLPRELPCSMDRIAECTESVVLERLKKMAYILPQYQTGHYSNLGVALLGGALGIFFIFQFFIKIY
jgi:CubicO group peptidase (beta-lactamase class C family)